MKSTERHHLKDNELAHLAVGAAGLVQERRGPILGAVIAVVVVLAWAAGFGLLNHVYFLASEEPGLRRQFGEAYERYRAHVPRWIPRRSPWAEPVSASSG